MSMVCNIRKVISVFWFSITRVYVSPTVQVAHVDSRLDQEHDL